MPLQLLSRQKKGKVLGHKGRFCFSFFPPFLVYKLWAGSYTGSWTLDIARVSEHLADVTSLAVLKDINEVKLPLSTVNSISIIL